MVLSGSAARTTNLAGTGTHSVDSVDSQRTRVSEVMVCREGDELIVSGRLRRKRPIVPVGQDCPLDRCNPVLMTLYRVSRSMIVSEVSSGESRLRKQASETLSVTADDGTRH